MSIPRNSAPSGQPRVVQPPPFAHLLPPRPNPVINDALIDPVLRDPAPAPAPAPVRQVPLEQINAPAAGNGVVSAVGEANRNPLHEYMVDVTHSYTESTPSRTRGRPDVMRRMQLVKSQRIARFDTISRVDFINACLSVHELEDQFRASPIRGPGMKISWTGSSGGKSGARTFETDEEFNLLRNQLLAVDKGSKDITVFISFDTEEMDVFKVRKRHRVGNDLTADGQGAKVPRAGCSDDDVKLHAEHIMMLKRTHPCEVHRGEHGQPGYCYVFPDGEHLGLQARRLAVWAAAMAAGDATRHIPPNLPDFDGHQNGGLVVPKSRGRPPAGTRPLLPPTQPTMDPSALLVAALVPLLTSLTQQNNNAAPPASSSASAPSDPAAPGSSMTTPDVAEPLSPPSTPTSYIQDCLVAFKADSGIDLVRHKDALAHRDLTPDIIGDVPHEHLASILCVSEGKTLRYQRFCREWFSRQKAKLALQL